MKRLLSILGPGLLVAATGVGAGDLATAGFAGMKLGPAILWAILLGAFLKFALTEGLARWQLATGQTILEGSVRHLGPVAAGIFLLYLLPWSFFVGAALISACGVTLHAILEPLDLFGSPAPARLILGAGQSVLAVVLVVAGGFRAFERIMAVCVGVMFASVIVTAALLKPNVLEIASGLVIPRIPQFADGGLTWTIALLGGVGGTLTVICYGYWIREQGRETASSLRTCRIDLAAGYAMTALFGIAMVVIADGMTVDGRGAGLIVALADQLTDRLGLTGRWIFLVGAWAAVFSSMLGVWQAVPYIFADFVGLRRAAPGRTIRVDTRGRVYRMALLALALVPLTQVHHPFREVQKYYAVIGAAFIPLLAVALLLLNRRVHVGALRNRRMTVVVLVAAVMIFVLAGAYQVAQQFG